MIVLKGPDLTQLPASLVGDWHPEPRRWRREGIVKPAIGRAKDAKKGEAAARAKAQEEADEMAGFQAFPSTQFSDHLRGCRFAFNSEIRRVGCRKATFFALKGEMPIRFVRCSLIPACERGAVSGARYDRRWRANGLPCDRSGARRPWRTLSGPVPSPSQPAARPCKRCLIFRGKNLDFIGKISHLAAKDCP